MIKAEHENEDAKDISNAQILQPRNLCLKGSGMQGMGERLGLSQKQTKRIFLARFA